ncbi:MAG: hypothetical protein F4X53_03960 [Acidimicrobiales bacterium]|nr:hypothetical protein [Acidimicrobiales bacterium]
MESTRVRETPSGNERRRRFAVLLAVVLAAPLALPAPSAAQKAGAFTDGAEPWTESDCTGQVPIVVGSDAKAQSDIYSAVTLAGAIGTDCVILAGARDGAMPAGQRARLNTAAAGGYIIGGTAAVPDAKTATREMTRLAGTDRWTTATLVGGQAGGDVNIGHWLTTSETVVAAGAKLDPSSHSDWRLLYTAGQSGSSLPLRSIAADDRERRAHYSFPYIEVPTMPSDDSPGDDLRDDMLRLDDPLPPLPSPDGSRVAAVVEGLFGRRELWLFDLTGGGEPVMVTNKLWFYGGWHSHRRTLQWSPDGKLLSFNKAHDGSTPPSLWVVNADGTDPTLLAQLPNNYRLLWGEHFSVLWSPDSQRLAYAQWRGAEGVDTSSGRFYSPWIVNVDGTYRTQLPGILHFSNNLFNSNQRYFFIHGTGREDQLPNYVDSHHMFRWSPSGDRLVYNAGHWRRPADCSGDSCHIGSSLWMVDISDRHNPRAIGSRAGSETVSWSPDGQYLIYTGCEEWDLKQYEQEIVFCDSIDRRIVDIGLQRARTLPTTGGGTAYRWTTDSTRLVYIPHGARRPSWSASNWWAALAVIDVTVSGSFTPRTARAEEAASSRTSIRAQSPTGERFVSLINPSGYGHDATHQLWSMAIDGSDNRLLGNRVCCVHLSPARSQLLFGTFSGSSTHRYNEETDAYATDGRLTELWLIDADGSNLKRIVNAKYGLSGVRSVWSPDGTKVIVEFLELQPDGALRQRRVYLFDSEGSGRRELNDRSHGWSWSPDGSHMAYVTRRNLSHQTLRYDSSIRDYRVRQLWVVSGTRADDPRPLVTLHTVGYGTLRSWFWSYSANRS